MKNIIYFELIICAVFKGYSYLYNMKKNIIWLVGIIMGACCLGLIYM